MSTMYPGWGGTSYDEMDNRTVADESLRNDPERKAAWATHIAAQQAAYAEAHEHLRRAAAALRRLGYVDAADDALVARGQEAVQQALVRFDRDAHLVMAEPSDTYLGNKAAFGLPKGDCR